MYVEIYPNRIWEIFPFAFEVYFRVINVRIFVCLVQLYTINLFALDEIALYINFPYIQNRLHLTSCFVNIKSHMKY